ncbi:MAG TPA: hypothetical protein VN721_13180 [Flavipsychrobacter sp.]|nr:hypothetical protein [Flavipsychrobacter sp.]
MLYKITLSLFFTLTFFISNAQGLHHNYDTLTTEEINQLEIGIAKSTFGYVHLTDSFSIKNDSVNASINMLKIDPYYFISGLGEPTPIETIINERKFHLTLQAKKDYRNIYAKALNSPKSPSYKKFKAMAEEDQLTRKRLDKCADSITFQILNNKMIATDSAHFNYLYNYVQKNGWPTLSNGSLYAAIIAIHDHAHHSFYFPYMEKAIVAGQLGLEPLQLIYEWMTTNFETKDLLNYPKKIPFDVTSILKDQLPSSLQRIEYFTKKYCPVHLYFVYEFAPDNHVTEVRYWINRQQHRTNNILDKLVDDLSSFCPKNIQPDTWAVHYLPASDHIEKITLYLVY